MLGVSAALSPLSFEFSASGKRFLCADPHGGKSRIETGTREGFFLEQASAKKNGEAADEGVARAGCVNGLDGKGLDQFRALGSSQQRAASAESDHHAAETVLQRAAIEAAAARNASLSTLIETQF